MVRPGLMRQATKTTRKAILVTETRHSQRHRPPPRAHRPPQRRPFSPQQQRREQCRRPRRPGGCRSGSRCRQGLRGNATPWRYPFSRPALRRSNDDAPPTHWQRETTQGRREGKRGHRTRGHREDPAWWAARSHTAPSPGERSRNSSMDHTLVQDYVEELRLRGEMNNLIKDQLRQWRTVAYLSSGWSLHPRVSPNDLCTYDPVAGASPPRSVANFVRRPYVSLPVGPSSASLPGGASCSESSASSPDKIDFYSNPIQVRNIHEDPAGHLYNPDTFAL